MNRTSSIGFGSLRNIFHATKLIDDPPRGETANESIGQRRRGIALPTTLGFFWTAEILRKNPPEAQVLTSTKCANAI